MCSDITMVTRHEAHIWCNHFIPPPNPFLGCDETRDSGRTGDTRRVQCKGKGGRLTRVCDSSDMCDCDSKRCQYAKPIKLHHSLRPYPMSCWQLCFYAGQQLICQKPCAEVHMNQRAGYPIWKDLLAFFLWLFLPPLYSDRKLKASKPGPDT